MKRLADYDPFTRTSTFFEYDHLTDTSIITSVQDVEAHLDWSKGLAKDDEYSKKGMKKEMWHYAHIPDSVMHKWLIEGVDINDTKELIRRVNTPDYAYLKVTSKKHT